MSNKSSEQNGNADSSDGLSLLPALAEIDTLPLFRQAVPPGLSAANAFYRRLAILLCLIILSGWLVAAAGMVFAGLVSTGVPPRIPPLSSTFIRYVGAGLEILSALHQIHINLLTKKLPQGVSPDDSQQLRRHWLVAIYMRLTGLFCILEPLFLE